MSVKKSSAATREPPTMFPGGSIVWARKNDNQYWPARVVDMATESDSLVGLRAIPTKNERVVHFFASDDVDTVNTNEIVGYVCGMPTNGEWPLEMTNAVHLSNEHFLGLLPLLPNGKRFKKHTSGASTSSKRARPPPGAPPEHAPAPHPPEMEVETPNIDGDMGDMAATDVERVHTELQELAKVSKQMRMVVGNKCDASISLGADNSKNMKNIIASLPALFAHHRGSGKDEQRRASKLMLANLANTIKEESLPCLDNAVRVQRNLLQIYRQKLQAKAAQFQQDRNTFDTVCLSELHLNAAQFDLEVRVRELQSELANLS